MYTTDNLSGVPVYEQIVRQTEAFILAGIMQPDAPMPSVRAVATEIAANPNTVQKAYSNLLGRGILYAVPGKGSFIAPDAKEKLRAELEKKLESVERLAAQFAGAGIAKQEVLDAVERGYESAHVRSLKE
jgi:Predicted transcriptional regulators